MKSKRGFLDLVLPSPLFSITCGWDGAGGGIPGGVVPLGPSAFGSAILRGSNFVRICCAISVLYFVWKTEALMSAAPHRTAPVLEPALSPVPAPAPPQEPKSRKWLIFAGLLILIAAAAAWYFTRPVTQQANAPAAGTPSAVRTAAATTGTLNRSLRITGQTSAIDFANITAPMLRGPDAGRDLILLTVAPSGSWVKKGALVAQIDAQSLIDHVDDLADTIKTAEADIRKRQAEQSIELENIQQTVRVNKAEMDKLRLEYNASETQTDIQRQLLKLSLDEAEAKHKQSVADIADKKAAHTAEIKILQYTLLRHTRHRDRHTNDVKAFSVYASMDGLVVMQQIWRGSEMGQVQQGDRLSPGQPFMKIVNTKKMQVEATVNQAESSDFRVGQDARIKLDAFGGLEFDGKVHSIGALAAGGFRNSYYVRTVPVRVQILGNDPRLIPDLSAASDVRIDSAANKTIIPRSAIKVEDGKTVVYVKKADGTFEQRAITVGLTSDTQAAVESGVRAGEIVQIG